MTNLEKMKELVASSATKEQVIQWAYMNRVWLSGLAEEDEFKTMKVSVDDFMGKEKELRHEEEMWNDFLDAEYIQ